MATHVVQVAPRLCLQVLRRLAVARPIIRRQFSDAAEDVQENHQQQQQQQRLIFISNRTLCRIRVHIDDHGR